METRPVVGWEGLYEIEIEGDTAWIVSLNYNKTGKRKRLAMRVGIRGYALARLSRRGRSFENSVHILVCQAFHGLKPEPKSHAAHRNDVKTDNRPSNLYWASPEENYRDRDRNGKTPRGSQNGATKLTSDEVLEIRRAYVAKELRQYELADKFGVHRTTIRDILYRKIWKHL